MAHDPFSLTPFPSADCLAPAPAPVPLPNSPCISSNTNAPTGGGAVASSQTPFPPADAGAGLCGATCRHLPDRNLPVTFSTRPDQAQWRVHLALDHLAAPSIAAMEDVLGPLINHCTSASHGLEALASQRLFQAWRWDDPQLAALTRHLRAITIFTAPPPRSSAHRHVRQRPDAGAPFYDDLSQFSSLLPLGAEMRLIRPIPDRLPTCPSDQLAGKIEARSTATFHLAALQDAHGLDWPRLAAAVADVVARSGRFAQAVRDYHLTGVVADWPVCPVVAIRLSEPVPVLQGQRSASAFHRLQADIFQFIQRQIMDGLQEDHRGLESPGPGHLHRLAPVFELEWDSPSIAAGRQATPSPPPQWTTPYRIVATGRPHCLSQRTCAIGPGESGAALRGLDRMACAGGADARRFVLTAAAASMGRDGAATGNDGPPARTPNALALDDRAGSGYGTIYESCGFMLANPARRVARRSAHGSMIPHSLPCDRCGQMRMTAVAGTLHCRRCGALLVGS